jgi:hypothetical protein
MDVLPVSPYRHKTWSLIIGEEHTHIDRLRVCEKMELRRISGPKREGVVGSWRRLHTEELHDLYASPNIVWVIKSRRMKLAGHAACRQR